MPDMPRRRMKDSREDEASEETEAIEVAPPVVAAVPVPMRELPKVRVSKYLAVVDKPAGAIAGFNRHVKSSRLDRAYKTIPEWEAVFQSFMSRPTR